MCMLTAAAFLAIYTTIGQSKHLAAQWSNTTSNACVPPTQSACGEAIPICRNSISRATAWNLAVLPSNMVYRVGDILRQTGMRYYHDSAAILCQARYRGTMLRTVLQNASLWKGTSLRNWPDTTLEKVLSSHAQGYYSMLPDDTHSGLQLGSKKLMLETTERALMEMKCSHANESSLVVHIRMGDKTFPDLSSIIPCVWDALQGGDRKEIILNGVINFSPNPWLGKFHYNESQVATIGNDISTLVWTLRKRFQKPVTVRSEPSADDDICFAVKSPNVCFVGTGGFVGLLESLHKKVHGDLHGSTSALERIGIR